MTFYCGMDLRARDCRVCGIDTVQALRGHKNPRTTMIYTYVLNQGEKGVRSPLAPV
jgi:integrase